MALRRSGLTHPREGRRDDPVSRLKRSTGRDVQRPSTPPHSSSNIRNASPESASSSMTTSARPASRSTPSPSASATTGARSQWSVWFWPGTRGATERAGETGAPVEAGRSGHRRAHHGRPRRRILDRRRGVGRVRSVTVKPQPRRRQQGCGRDRGNGGSVRLRFRRCGGRGRRRWLCRLGCRGLARSWLGGLRGSRVAAARGRSLPPGGGGR